MCSVENLASKCGSGHITLEALLDSPGLTPSPLSESVNDSTVNDVFGLSGKPANNHKRQQTSVHGENHNAVSTAPKDLHINEAQRRALLRDYCIELLFVLRSQDVNGYFLSYVPTRGYSKDVPRTGLLNLEKKLLSQGYSTLSEFKSDVSQLFGYALRHYHSDTPAHSEAQRLLVVVSDWFLSLSTECVELLNTERPSQPFICRAISTKTPLNDIPTETNLGILNPDNHGFITSTERIRTLGEEVGQPRSGSHLLPSGGYREDRRNKVIPYTYLDYGPFYSFAPNYDSGASHCSPEAHQLVLGTSWIPARAAFLTPCDSPVDIDPTEADDVTMALCSDAVRAALAVGDHQLAISLAVADMEQRSTTRLATVLDDILPGPEVDDDCVYSMCLANALTKAMPYSQVRSTERHEDDDLAQKSDVNDQSEVSTGTSSIVVDLDHFSAAGDEAAFSEPFQPQSHHVPFAEELSQSAADLVSLYSAQYRRLGDTSHSSIISGSTIQPSSAETIIAHRLSGRLVNLSKHVHPRDLIHPYTVRRAMGLRADIAPLPEDIFVPKETDEILLASS